MKELYNDIKQFCIDNAELAIGTLLVTAVAIGFSIAFIVIGIDESGNNSSLTIYLLFAISYFFEFIILTRVVKAAQSKKAILSLFVLTSLGLSIFGFLITLGTWCGSNF
jgi:hypothetical protein